MARPVDGRGSPCGCSCTTPPRTLPHYPLARTGTPSMTAGAARGGAARAERRKRDREALHAAEGQSAARPCPPRARARVASSPESRPVLAALSRLYVSESYFHTREWYAIQ